MHQSDTIGLLKGYLGSQHYGQGGRAALPPQPFVTISRDAGSGSRVICNELIRCLRQEDRRSASTWLYFDRDLIEQVIRDHDLPEDAVRIMLSSRYSRVLSCIDELFGKYPTWPSVARKTSQTIMKLAEIGNVVIVGRGGHIVTRRLPYGFRVRLIGSRARRLNHVCENHGMTREEAKKYIDYEDRSRSRYLRDLFGVDNADVTLFDTTINTDYVSYKDAARMIADQVLRIRAEIETNAEHGDAAAAPAN